MCLHARATVRIICFYFCSLLCPFGWILRVGLCTRGWRVHAGGSLWIETEALNFLYSCCEKDECAEGMKAHLPPNDKCEKVYNGWCTLVFWWACRDLSFSLESYCSCLYTRGQQFEQKMNTEMSLYFSFFKSSNSGEIWMAIFFFADKDVIKRKDATQQSFFHPRWNKKKARLRFCCNFHR